VTPAEAGRPRGSATTSDTTARAATVAAQPGPSSDRPGRLRTRLAVAWTVSTVVTGGLVLATREVGPESATRLLPAVLLVGATNAALFAWLGPLPARDLPDAAAETHRWRLAGLIAAAVVVLFGAGLAGVAVLGLLAAVAAGVLVALRRQVGRREVGWALLLGVLAGAAGALEEGADSLAEVLTGLLQLPLTVVTLLAGWALARRAGWVQAGIGSSLALTAGPARALRVAVLAFLFALPWALSNIVNGPPEEDHVTSGWQAVAAAVRPGIAEEAWGRVFLIAALYVLFRRAARADTALLSAALVSTLWFAFLHAPANPVGALLLALLYGLPITWLFLRRGLEAAIGFHISIDLIRFGAAYLAFTGVWFR
jgi:hypothetical protein